MELGKKISISKTTEKFEKYPCPLLAEDIYGETKIFFLLFFFFCGGGDEEI